MVSAWPPDIFSAPVLRTLDANARTRIMNAGRILPLSPGSVLYSQNDTGDSFFVVIAGSVSLTAVRRGHQDPTVVRVARRFDTFGDEATLPGRARRMTATAAEPGQIVEIPISIYQKAVGRVGGDPWASQEARTLRRQATQDLLRTIAFTASLPEEDIGMVLDAIRYETFARSDRIYGVGDKSDRFYMIAAGLVQLQVQDEDRIKVCAYLAPGDFFGDEELLAGQVRQVGAMAMGECQLMSMSAEALQTLVARNPDMLGRIRRVATDRRALQREIVSDVASNTTRHVFKDLYRMQMARSLLTIDQDICVRCGHCAWSCASLYGVARLTRRGDKVMTRLNVVGADEKHLMVPNSCQHCKNPVCMIDCPTGAIGRDPQGEVFIRDELCTGCGNCAKACPWENIRMAPRPKGSPIAEGLRTSTATTVKSIEQLFSTVAVKCDLCRDYQAPACVQACPTEAIVRLDPTQDLADVASILGTHSEATQRRGFRIMGTLVPALALFVASCVGLLGWGLHNKGFLSPATDIGYICGWVSAALMAALIGYPIPKRFVRLWMQRRKDTSVQRETRKTRSKVRPMYILHIAMGLLAVGGIIAHTGLRMPGNGAGALHLAFWLTAVIGAFGAGVYRVLPRRLAQIERTGALPEDLKREHDNLIDRLYRALSGRTDLVKSITDRLLLPYAHSRAGPLKLVLSGRTLSEEERRLDEEIKVILEGRGVGKLAGLRDIVRISVEMRALPARRWLSWMLRAWMPVHIIFSGLTVSLLLVHIVGALWL